MISTSLLYTTLVLQGKASIVMNSSARVDPELTWKGLLSPQNNPGTRSV